MSFKIVTGKTGSSHVSSADDGLLNAAQFGTGDYVVDAGKGALAATIVDNNNITIGPGDIVMQGRHMRVPFGETVNISIDSGAVGYNRKDLIVAEYANSAGIESGTIKVITGTPSAGTATAPTATTGDILEGDTLHQMTLYEVAIEGVNIISATALFAKLDAGHVTAAELTATIGTTWTGSAAPYSQEVAVTGIRATDNPIIDLVPSSTYATALLEEAAWANIYKITTAANAITVYAHAKTTQAVSIRLKVVR